MARGPGATLCPKCSQHSLDPKGAVCLQRDRRVLVSRGRECLFGFPSYLIALAVESERAAVGGLLRLLAHHHVFNLLNLNLRNFGRALWAWRLDPSESHRWLDIAFSISRAMYCTFKGNFPQAAP